MTSDDKPLLEVRGLTRYFGNDVALHDLSFAMEARERLGLLGLPGAGKTTLLRIIMGVQLPSEGQVFLRGFDVQNESESAKASVAIVPESCDALPATSVQEVLELSRRFRPSDTDGVERCRRLCDQVGLDVARQVRDLSPEERRTLQFVDALQHDPDLLIIDEPFRGIEDSSSARAILDDYAARSKGLLVSSRDPAVLASLCERVIVLAAGELVAIESSPRRLLDEVYRVRCDTEAPVLPEWLCAVDGGPGHDGYFVGSGADLVGHMVPVAPTDLDIRRVGLEELLRIRYGVHKS